MNTMASRITIGVDTHLDTHVAAALDERGTLLEVEAFETTPCGYDKLVDWAGQSVRSNSPASKEPAATAPD